MSHPIPHTYIDTSALIRALDANHPSSPAIQKFFRDEDLLESGLYSSELTHLEAIRVAVRTDDENLRNRIDAIFDSSFITTVPIDTQVMRAARSLDIHVKSLDAIHVATNRTHRSGWPVLTYDKNMIKVLNHYNIQTVSP